MDAGERELLAARSGTESDRLTLRTIELSDGFRMTEAFYERCDEDGRWFVVRRISIPTVTIIEAQARPHSDEARDGLPEAD